MYEKKQENDNPISSFMQKYIQVIIHKEGERK